MDHDHPCRSVLYVPADHERAIVKARELPADALLFDLEDAVAPDRKAEARSTLCAAFAAGGFQSRILMIRINAFDTDWGDADLDAITPLAPQAIVLPKVCWPSDVEALARMLDARPGLEHTRIWAMIETALGVQNSAEVARAPRMMGLILGTNDLAAEIGCRPRNDRLPLMGALQYSLIAARAAGVACIDGVYNAFRDLDGLAAECEQGRDLGMDGKSLIHPAQIAAANAAFSPSVEEIDRAQRRVTAWEEALRDGHGIAVADGQIVENMHIVAAKAVPSKAEAAKD